MSAQRRQSGQTVVLFVLCLAVLLGVLGLGADVGAARYEQTNLQTIADAAALAGATEIPYGDVQTGAQNAAVLNGFASGSNGETLTVNYPPASGPHAGNSQYVEVIATRIQVASFLSVFGVTSLSPNARAVAYLGSGSGCVYALDPSASGAVTVNGSLNVQLQCSMYVDSSSAQALTANGSGTLSAKAIGVVGGALVNAMNVNPTPVSGIVPLGDPLASIPTPSTSGPCTSPTMINGTGNFTLTPGVYCSTLIINGSPNITLSPGTYVLKSGIIMNGTPTLNGSGVTLFNNSGSFTLNGSSTSNLSAPTTGPYAGILVFQNRTDSSQLTINGSNSTVFNGAIYAAKARIVDNGSGTLNAYSILVGDTITLNGSESINNDYTSLAGGSPIKSAVLVE